MTEDAALESPATEEVVEQEPTQAEKMAEVYDRLTDDRAEEKQPAEESADEKPAEETPQKTAPPSELPGAVKQHWDAIPAEAREAVLKSQREMSQKLSAAHRDIQGIGPIRDVVTRAATELPEIAKMRPEDVAQELWGLFQAGQELRRDPAGAIRKLAQQHNVDLGAKAPEGEAARTINTLQQRIAQQAAQLRQLAQAANPQAMRQQFDSWSAEKTVEQQLQEFSASAPHWDAVESYLPTVIPVVQAKMGEGAAPAEVLRAAYDMAVSTFVPNAGQAEAGQAPAAQAPERVKAAVKAKSVNVKSQPGKQAAPSNPREAMSRVYDQMMNN